MAADLGACSRGDLVGGVEARLDPTDVHATLQDLGRLSMTIQRLQVEPQTQQLLSEPGRKGPGAAPPWMSM